MTRGSEDFPIVADARALAEGLLAGLGRRLAHTRAVAGRAAEAAPAVPPAQRPVLVAAAWLHDIGYAPPLHRTGFHPLDGARWLAGHGWDQLVVDLVAHHSAAALVAEVRGLRDELRPFDRPEHAGGPLPDALTFADQTTGPDGRPMDVEARMADMLRRHGPGSPNARAHPRRAPLIRAAVRRTEARLRAAAPRGGTTPAGEPEGPAVQPGR